ncbi:hypothetical protein PGTUg99_021165 [Puccinia graminis f. sp. tritici]|uniref:Uncharacterized protein n=1 Tax=Puccinia graminis f. sp. tritici TaxID=56615 RepID=A0A5B0RV34_PUCGR|nr:hypothetical protein PGTUg99_021165 [Puccinia graminis f. sp. tritici]
MLRKKRPKTGQKPLKTAVAQRSGPFFAAHMRSVSGVVAEFRYTTLIANSDSAALRYTNRYGYRLHTAHSQYLKITLAPQSQVGAHAHYITMVPRKIYLSFKNEVFAVETKELLIVRELAQAARKEFPDDLRGINILKVTLHTNEDADQLTPHSRLAKHTAQLLRCRIPETPLIVKGEPPSHPRPSSCATNTELKLLLLAY